VNSAKIDAARYDRHKNAFIVELAERRYRSKNYFNRKLHNPLDH